MKTLILDIETAPSIAYVWDFWQQNIQHDSVIDYQGYIMCFAYSWLGDNHIHCLENRTDNDKNLVSEILGLLDEADFVVAHNGKKFDIPFIKARAVIHGLNPPSPFKVIDTLQIAKKEMNFKRNSLEFLAQTLGVGEKLKHNNFPGIKLWDECIKGNDEAWKEMTKYNMQDVSILEKVYIKLRSWYSNHPNITISDNKPYMCCPKCGSSQLHRRGFYYTNKGQYQRYKCLDCGGWSAETYTANTIEQRKRLLTSK